MVAGRILRHKIPGPKALTIGERKHNPMSQIRPSAEEKALDMIGFGNPFQDLIVELDKLPPTNINVRMHDYVFQGGGNVPTATVAAARLGLRTSILGVAGDDMFGRANLADFIYNNVGTSHLILDAGKRTDFCICVSEREIGGKEFISCAGDYRPLEITDLDEAYIKSSKILHIGDMMTPAKFLAADWMHEAGGVVSIDAAYYRPDIYENYKYLDIFIASETYLKSMRVNKGDITTEKAARFIHSQGPEIVIFTLGERGCAGTFADTYFELPAFIVDVVDSTGAGDVFHGAFNYAWLQGWDVPHCARFSSAVSAIKCTRLGGRAGIASLETVNRYLNYGEIDYSEIDKRMAHYRQGMFSF